VLSVPPDYPTFWPLAGLILAALLLSERREWPLLLSVAFAAALLVDLMQHKPFVVSAATELASVTEAVVGAALICRYTGRRPDLCTVRQVIIFVGFGAILAPAVGATLGTLVNVAAGLDAPWQFIWAVWWIADVAGVIVMAPPILTGLAWRHDFRSMDGEARRQESKLLSWGAVIAGVFAIGSWFVFTSNGGTSRYKFLLFAGVIAAAAIGGPFAGATGFSAVALSAIAGLAYVAPPASMVSAARAAAVLEAQGFLFVAGVTSLVVSASLFENKVLAAQAMKDAAQLASSTSRVERMAQQVILVMGKVVEARDPYTQGHEQGVAKLSRMIAQEIGMTEDEVDGIEVAALVHDLGKLAVPSEILTKPGKLSNIEYDLIKSHSQAGYDILKDIDFDWPIADIVLQHHERMDGSGYPSGLSGDEILTAARILMVADVIEAMGAHRPYRPALGLDAAMAEITGSPGKFDPQVVSACVRLREAGLIEI
jgi:putative nucleotidyltransferase with HDIG domain